MLARFLMRISCAQAFCLVALWLFSCFMIHAQYSQGGKVKGFKVGEFYPVSEKVPPNRLKFLVTGAEAEPFSAELIALKDMRLEAYAVNGRTNIIAKAPQCFVHAEGRQISDITSTGRLEMATGNGQFFIEGNEGFFCRVTNFSLIVSNHGRTVIRHGTVKLPAR